MRKIREYGDGFMALVESYDETILAVESHGQGKPIFFLHGWTMSRAFWQKQAAGLAGEFQVVTMDLRAHGDSGKALAGHTLPGYARDVKAVVDALGLDGFLLAGWSMTAPLVLEYWRRFAGGGLAALALVEGTPAPLNPADWNTHRMKGYDFELMNQGFAAMQADREGYTRGFVNNMFKNGQAGRELDWMLGEALKTPTAQAVAIFSDYLTRDYSGVLCQVDLPALVINGQSPFLSYGPKMGAWMAKELPKGRLAMFDKSGHLPFWEEPAKFNAELARLAREM